MKSNRANDASDWEALKAMLPTSFGKQSRKTNTEQAYSKTVRQVIEQETPSEKSQGISKPPTRNVHVDKDSEPKESDSDEDHSDDDLSDDDDVVDSDTLPISHEIRLNDHTRAVSALALDPAGARLITGGYDYEVKFWDFAGMNQSFRPFRSFKPCEDHHIHDLVYSLTGDSFLIISGNSTPELYNRDGIRLHQYAKGDPYIRDLRHTSGHVGALTGGAWHPSDRNIFATSSQDGTLRIWDVERHRKQKIVVAYKSRARGGRSPATALAYSPDSKLLGGAFMDGTINLWSTSGNYATPSITIREAHTKETETASILFSRDNHTLVSRGGDDSVKVWDIRKTSQPVRTAYNLEVVNPETNVIFSPDERWIVTGTSCPKGKGYGKLVFLDRETLDVRRTMSINQSSVVKVLWHPRINQIITGSADGSVGVFYSPTHSLRGAKLCVVKAPKQRAIDDIEIDRPIIAPHSLPMFKDDKPRTSKRKREKMRKDPRTSHRPDLPVKGPGKGGRVGITEQQQVIASFSKDTTRDEDPREALLKYASLAEDEPMWISNVYEKTQPTPVFNEDDDEEEEQPRKK